MSTFLVTGASSGIGRATVLRLDRGGHSVLATVRKQEDAESLRAAASDRLETLILDITDGESITAAREHVEGAGGLDGLVNNAGSAFPGPLESLPIDDLRSQLEVNVVGQVAVTQALLPALRRSRGRIVFVSSIGGRIALPFNGPYNASKFAIEAIGDSLRRELAPLGVEVVLVEPGSVATPIWDKATARGDEIVDSLAGEAEAVYGERLRKFRDLARQTGERGIHPDEVAAVIETALTASPPKTRYLVGRDAKMRARVNGLVSDRLFDRMVARQLAR